jgi:hypothetical protein
MSLRVTVWFDSACPPDRATLLARLHARECDRILTGAAAFAAIWRAIPILRPLGLLAGWPPVTPLFDAAYRAFLRHRPRLQRMFGRDQPGLHIPRHQRRVPLTRIAQAAAGAGASAGDHPDRIVLAGNKARDGGEPLHLAVHRAELDQAG